MKLERTKTGPDAGKPYISNYPPLADWLRKHDAYCAWQRYDDRLNIEGWVVGVALCLITVQPDGRGWDIYTSCPDISIEATLRDAEERLIR